MATLSIGVKFWILKSAGIKHQPAHELSHLHNTGVRESVLESELAVLTITDVQPEVSVQKQTQRIGIV